MKKIILILLCCVIARGYTIFPVVVVDTIKDSFAKMAFHAATYTQLADSIAKATKTVEYQMKAVNKIGKGLAEGKIDEMIYGFRYQGAALTSFASALYSYGAFKISKRAFRDAYTKGLDKEGGLKFTDRKGNILSAAEIKAGNRIYLGDPSEWQKLRHKNDHTNLGKTAISLAKSNMNVAKLLQDTKYYSESMKRRGEDMELLFASMGGEDATTIGSLEKLSQLTAMSVQQGEDAMNLALSTSYAAGKEKELQAHRESLKEAERIENDRKWMELITAPQTIFKVKPLQKNNFFDLHEENAKRKK